MIFFSGVADSADTSLTTGPPCTTERNSGSGGELVTGTLMDYAVPHADDLPSFKTDQTVTPSPRNPMGAKGIGEAATIGSTPAIVNAVVDALKPLGVKHLDMPLRPERVWQALKNR